MPEAQTRTLAELTIGEEGKLLLKGKEVPAMIVSHPKIVRVPAPNAFSHSQYMRELEEETARQAPVDANAVLSGNQENEFLGRVRYYVAAVIYYRIKDTAPN